MRQRSFSTPVEKRESVQFPESVSMLPGCRNSIELDSFGRSSTECHLSLNPDVPSGPKDSGNST